MLTFSLREDLNKIVPVFKKYKRNLHFGDSEIYFCRYMSLFDQLHDHNSISFLKVMENTLF